MSEFGRKIPAVTAAVAIFLGSGAIEKFGTSLASGTPPPVEFNSRNCKRFELKNLPPASPKNATKLPNPTGKHPTTIRNMGKHVPQGTNEPHNNTVDIWHKTSNSYSTDYYLYDYPTFDHRYGDHTAIHAEVAQANGNYDNIAGYICKNVVSTK